MNKIYILMPLLSLVSLGQLITSGNCCTQKSEFDVKVQQVENTLKTMPAWKLRFLYSRTSSQDYKAYLAADEQAMFKQTVKRVARARREEMASAVFSGTKYSKSHKKDMSRHVARDAQRKNNLAKHNS